MQRLAMALICVWVLLALGPSPAMGEKQTAALQDPRLPAMANVPDAGMMAHVTIERQSQGMRLLRNGKPYFIKGIGGRDHLESAAAAGANSVRTWGAHDAAAVLEHAHQLDMTVMLGIWLSHQAADYLDPMYRKTKTAEIRRLVEQHKDHPALLMWSLGNETNLEGADTEPAWRFIDSLARMIKQLDPHHPVISVISCNAETLENIQRYAPMLDAVGINAYGAITRVRTLLERSSYSGPYIVTEWGVMGHWEVEQTIWQRPIEPDSSRKAVFQLSRYPTDILANRDRCLGAYVFLWSSKQERTPTWYSMILKDLTGTADTELHLPAVDAMQFNWTGEWPVNRAPEVSRMHINLRSAESSIILRPQEPMASRIQAWDPDNDVLTYLWEVLEEPTFLNSGGAYEPRPSRMGQQITSHVPVLHLNAPHDPGEYRLFAYVLDHHGHVATANIPFRVAGLDDRTLTAQRESLP